MDGGVGPQSVSEQSPWPCSWPLLAAWGLLSVVFLALTLIPRLLLQPHAGIHTTLLQQLFMPVGRAEGCRVPAWPQSQGRGSMGREHRAFPCAHLPRSTMRPSLSTRIWSAPTTVESLQGKAGCYSGLGEVTQHKELLSLLGRRTGLQVPQHFPDQPFPLSLPMCNNNGGAVGADLGQGGLDVPLGLRVKCRCGLRKGQGVRKGYRQLLGQGLLQSRAGLGWGLLLLPHLAG